MPTIKGPKITIIGGGTGTPTLLSELKYYAQNLTALVTMSDDGGSTGILRSEYGVHPPGDIRNCLVALSHFDKTSDLFNYRFEEGTLAGHNFGNIFLTAAEKLTGSFSQAVKLASGVLQITGSVEPITEDNVTLFMKTKKGDTYQGEYNIAYTNFQSSKPNFWLEPEATISAASRDAILNSDMIVVAPGSLYGSLAPALIVKGVREALEKTNAKCVYVCNLITQVGQTESFTVVDFASEIERLAGTNFLDYVIYNNAPIKPDLLTDYVRPSEQPVPKGDDIELQKWTSVGADLLTSRVIRPIHSADALSKVRTVIKHDPQKTAKQLMKVYFS